MKIQPFFQKNINLQQFIPQTWKGRAVFLLIGYTLIHLLVKKALSYYSKPPTAPAKPQHPELESVKTASPPDFQPIYPAQLSESPPPSMANPHIRNPDSLDTPLLQVPARIAAKPPKNLTAALINQLKQLDQEFEQLPSLAKTIRETFTNRTFNIEKNDLINKKLTELKSHLKKTYEYEFDNLQWHGNASFQRILFHDNYFIELISDPQEGALIIKTIIAQCSENTHIYKLFIYGIESNWPSFLASTAPNLMRSPSDIEWDYTPSDIWTDPTYTSMHTASHKSENPQEYRINLSEDKLEKIKLALINIRETFNQCPQKPVTSVESPDFNILHKASFPQLLKAFRKLISADNIEQLIHPCISQNMANECFDLLAGLYHPLLKKHKEEPHEILTYGHISHALDSKHIAGAYYKIFDTSYDPFSDHTKQGKENFTTLFTNAQENPDSPTAELLAIRFKQVFKLMLDNPSLEITLTNINEALTNP